MPGFFRRSPRRCRRDARSEASSVDLQLNVNNIFDRKYFSTAYPICATWAPGRSAVVTLNFFQ